jgi:hypothetical protein
MLTDRRRGHYLGTEIDEKWWKRYTREGFFARGNGEYWCDDEAFYFLRYLTRDPIVIPFDKVSDLKIGTWHCGRWAWGNPIIKLLWSHQGQSLSSGFILSHEKSEVQRYVDEIAQRISFPVSESGALAK